MSNFNFRTIETSDLEIIHDFVSRFEPYSDFNPISLISWDSKRSNMYAIKSDCMIIKICDYLTDKIILSILGKDVDKQTIEELLDYPEKLKMVPEISLSKITADFSLAEDRDSFDYVINLQDFTALSGKEYKPLRKRINHFLKNYRSSEIRILDLTDIPTQAQVADFTVSWAKNKEFDDKKISEDVASVKEYMRISTLFDCVNVGLFVNNEFVGYSFSQLLPNRWAMGHFGKTDVTYEHSFLYLEHAADKLILDRGAQYLNLQQDTGLAGLRQHKLSYKPVRFLKKYTVSKRV